MFEFAGRAVHWAGRHAFATVAASVIAVGAAGGGIGYAVASPHAASTTPTSPAATAPPKAAKAAAGRVATLIHGALVELAAQTGQSLTAVQSQLQAGKSIDAIAGAKAPAVEAEIMSAITKLADRAVKTGRITATQEATDLALAKTKVAALMAEPGTQLIKDARQALQFLQTHSRKGAITPASPSPSPAA